MNQSVRRLADIADTFNGKTPSKAEQRTEGFPVLKIKDISEWGQFRGRFESFVETSLAEKHAARWIRKGDALILNAAHNAAYVGSKMFLADDDVAGCLPTGEWLLVRPKQGEVVAEYLYYWLRTDSARSMIRFIVKGIHLYPKDVADMQVPWVPLSEQRRIVDLLSRAEGIVRLRREAEKKAAELIPTLFLDMFGDPATNPKGWRQVTVSEVLATSIRNGVSPSKGGTNPGRVLTLSAITRGAFDPLAVKTAMFAAPIAPDHEVTTRDFLVCRGNGNLHLVGQGCFPDADMSGVAFPDTAIAIRLSSAQVVPAYVAGLWGTRHIREQIEAAAKTTNGTYKINQASLASIRFPLPPIDVQVKFAQHYDGACSLRVQQPAATAKAQATFDALLANVFDSRGTS